MLKLFRKDSLTPQTERIYKVPLCIQDTIPIYRISENGIFELESPTNKDGGKKKIHTLRSEKTKDGHETVRNLRQFR